MLAALLANSASIFEWVQFVALPLALAVIGKMTFTARKAANDANSKNEALHEEIKTNHGKRAGEYLEELHKMTHEIQIAQAVLGEKMEMRLDGISETLKSHIALDAKNLDAIVKILDPSADVTQEGLDELRVMAKVFRTQVE